MHIKIQFGDKPLFLTEQLTPELEPYAHHDDAVLIDELSAPAVNSMLHEMKTEKIHAGVFIHPNIEELKKAFWKKFTILQTGGGLVYNDKEEILMIFRRGKWDLPKGKLDAGETLEACALREVREETGLQHLTVTEPLVVTWHSYDESGKHILKENHWFTMHTVANQKLQPQTEEDITEAKWVAKKDVKKYLANTFPSIKDVLLAAGLE